MKIPLLVIFCLCASPAFSESCGEDSRMLFSESAFRREVDRYPPLPEEEQRELFSEYAQTKDREVAHKLVRHNLRIVLKVALRYRHYKGLFMDLVQEGNIGLLKSIKKFDLDRETKFITFATYHIEGQIKRYLYDKLRLVRVKVDPENQNLFIRLKAELSEQGKSVFDEREWVAKKIGVSVDQVITMDLQLGKNNEKSLDQPLAGMEDITLAEVLPSEDTPLSNGLLRTDPIFKKHLAKFLKNYSSRNRDIFLKRRFSANPPSLRELADTHGLSSLQYVHTIEKKMIAALKKSMNQFGR